LVDEVFRLHRVGTFFPGADPEESPGVRDPDLAVTDLAGARCAADRFNGAFGLIVRNRDFDLDLGKEVDFVFGPTVDFRLPLLTTVTLDLR